MTTDHPAFPIFVNNIPTSSPIIGITRQPYLFIHSSFLTDNADSGAVILNEPISPTWGYPFDGGAYRVKPVDVPLSELRRDIHVDVYTSFNGD